MRRKRPNSAPGGAVANERDAKPGEEIPRAKHDRPRADRQDRKAMGHGDDALEEAWSPAASRRTTRISRVAPMPAIRKMRIHRFGGADVLQADDVEPSLPDAGQV